MADLPISEFDDAVFIQLCEALWSWDICDDCAGRRGRAVCCCTNNACATRHLGRTQRFFQFYENLVLDYHDEHPVATSRAFRTHGDIFRAIRLLRARPEVTRAALAKFISDSSSCSASSATALELTDATTLVVKVVAMLDCSPPSQCADRLETGTSRIWWRNDVPLRDYLRSVFPMQGSYLPQLAQDYNNGDIEKRPSQNSLLRLDDDLNEVGPKTMQSVLRATKLKKHLKIRFRPTHDIRNHLRLDRRRGELEIFHYASFLKEQLRATKGSSDNNNSSEDPFPPPPSPPTLLLPRQLLLETLSSLQRILFPLDDAPSQRLLRSLVRDPDYGFDPELLCFELNELLFSQSSSSSSSSSSPPPSSSAATMVSVVREDHDHDHDHDQDDNGQHKFPSPSPGSATTTTTTTRPTQQYTYLSARLSALYDEARGPPAPRTRLERRLQRRSGARHMMLATLAGVVLAVLLGLCALALSGVQAWIAWQAWKHPVPVDNGVVGGGG